MLTISVNFSHALRCSDGQCHSKLNILDAIPQLPEAHPQKFGGRSLVGAGLLEGLTDAFLIRQPGVLLMIFGVVVEYEAVWEAWQVDQRAQ